MVVLACQISSQGQNSEFKVYSNGLIYSEETMTKLSHIVDSLNLKYKICDFNKAFYSIYQTVGQIISLDTGDILSAKLDIDKQISIEEFKKKYPLAKIEMDVLILRQKYTNRDGNSIVYFQQFDLKDSYGFEIESKDVSLYDADLQNKWLSDYTEKTTYSKENIKAFYFPNKFIKPRLPDEYSRMIGYSDCLIDTTSLKFKSKQKEGWVELPNHWQALSLKKKKTLLDEMRSTRVIGYCSMDSRPRQHAVNIALLSAETTNWEIFLKSHLDIMNDRFDRMSDGSYAWEMRNTYIKELEELNINVSDLILGISFRIENKAQNHYYGNIGRIGRAISESENRNEIDEKILSIIKDPNLDDYNRAIFYFLFKNYNYHIKDENIKKLNIDKLNLAESTLPDYLKKGAVNK